MKSRKVRCLCLLLCLAALLGGCAYVPGSYSYAGPENPPLEVQGYYQPSGSFVSYDLVNTEPFGGFYKQRYAIDSAHGEIVIDYFRQVEAQEDDDALIFVFPILGGSNKFANYFARYFARNGYDTAVVHRTSDFKDPENVDHLEELFRNNVVRDRIAIDFFVEHMGKKRFGGFGISRGAINLAVTASVDRRLRYTVLALGGSDLAGMFRRSTEKGLRKYKRKVMAKKGLDEEGLHQFFLNTVKTDPKNLVQYADARNTLVVLGLFDRTVPYRYGHRLRKTIGYPRTVFLTAGHFTALLYTGFLEVVAPVVAYFPLPIDYVETEALYFFDTKFGRSRLHAKLTLLRLLQLPFNIIGVLVDEISR
jgi:hypothetical protein